MIFATPLIQIVATKVGSAFSASSRMDADNVDSPIVPPAAQ